MLPLVSSSTSLYRKCLFTRPVHNGFLFPAKYNRYLFYLNCYFNFAVATEIICNIYTSLFTYSNTGEATFCYPCLRVRKSHVWSYMDDLHSFGKIPLWLKDQDIKDWKSCLKINHSSAWVRM